VVHVVSSDSFAGIELHVLNLSRELRAMGCSAELACPPSASRLRHEAAAAEIPVLPSARWGRCPWVVALAREIAAEPPHVLHVHDGRAAGVGILLSFLARRPLVRTQHFVHPASVERGGLRGRVSRAMHRFLNRRLDGYVAVSRAVASGARARRETGRAEVIVIPPAVDLPSHDAASRAQRERRRIADPVVAFAGRFEAERQLDVLLRAVPRVLEQMPQSRFVLAGSGAAERSLRTLAGELVLRSNHASTE